MVKETIFVELVGLEEVFDRPFDLGIRRILRSHESHLYRFEVWDPLDAVQPGMPDISLVAVRPEEPWTAVYRRSNQCHCLCIGLLGAEQAMLGLPAVSSLGDLSSLVMLRNGQAEEGEPLWDRRDLYLPEGVPTIPFTSNTFISG